MANALNLMETFGVLVHLGNNRYRLFSEYILEWWHNGVLHRLIVPADFEIDMASVPRIVWPLISPFDLGNAAIPHDWFYHHSGAIPAGSHQIHTGTEWVDQLKPWSRQDADKLFARQMRETGVSKWRRRAAYRAVRLFGRGSW